MCISSMIFNMLKHWKTLKVIISNIWKVTFKYQKEKKKKLGIYPSEKWGMIEWNQENNNLYLYQEKIFGSEWLAHGKILQKP